ncbi:hypothetical protein OSB04_011204 [Centaurea solstitialis]|uniref:Disease resistance protein n=1 Tax=Centaurea solstitialis TaxID=347529 RepID=A0AA38T8Z5_9ASTR|nr:hypothetical protein OSB04_011204 [Centaurea solstitialis]
MARKSIGLTDLVIRINFPIISFRTLKISFCNNMELCNCPSSIQTLLGGGVTENNEVLINSSMSMLEMVDINHWPNLKSIVELSSFIHLTKLQIMNCPSLESFPHHEFSNLTSLTGMAIVDCPSMDASFPRKLKKPMSTTFSNLTCRSVYGVDRQKMMLFEKLESLSMGLQHLTSLEGLNVCKCPKVKDLPDSTLDSLLWLFIFGCPNLRCNGTGSYEHRISHIPRVDIRSRDSEDIQWHALLSLF